MYFRDMGPFENPLFMHVNIGFNISDPPGAITRLGSEQLEIVKTSSEH